MLKIGCHISIGKGFYHAGKEALSLGANTFQFFTRNPRGGKAKALNPEDLQNLHRLMKEEEFAPIFAHGSYTMNLASNKKDTRDFSKGLLKEDLERVEEISNCYYIFHPGSHVKQGVDAGIQQIIEALNEAIGESQSTPILLEGMSGKGTEIGGDLRELKKIIDGVEDSRRLGICIDTCHLYSAGYDIVDRLEEVLEEIDRLVGLERLKAVHLNDSKTAFHSRKDRHEVLGKGTIGEEALERIIRHPSLRHLPFNLETPNDLSGYEKEIKRLRKAWLKDV